MHHRSSLYHAVRSTQPRGSRPTVRIHIADTRVGTAASGVAVLFLLMPLLNLITVLGPLFGHVGHHAWSYLTTDHSCQTLTDHGNVIPC